MKIINKLQKLIAHEKSARAINNVAEADNFARRIQSLLDKHNLSMSEVEIKAQKESPIDVEPVQGMICKIEKWHRALLYNLSRLNGCYPIESSAGFQAVVGRPQDRQIVINLFNYFEKLGEELAEKYMDDRNTVIDAVYTGVRYQVKADRSKHVRDSFLLGFVASVAHRLEEISKTNMEQSSNSAALIFLGDRNKENEAWVKEHLHIETTISGAAEAKELDRSAFMRGASAGDSIALTDKTLK